MDACAVNWPLVLEFLTEIPKAFAAPLTAVVVAWFAVRGFRRQKAIERRVDWYEKMHRSLAGTANAYALAAYMDDSKDARNAAAQAASNELAFLCTGGFMYADQRGFEAMQRLYEGMAHLQVGVGIGPIAPSTADAVGDMCNRAADVLAQEFRKELRLDEVTPRAGVTQTVAFRRDPE